MAAKTTLALTDGEVFLLYALAGREIAECALAGIGGGIAGPHAEHKQPAYTALAKLSDAVLAIHERQPAPVALEAGDRVRVDALRVSPHHGRYGTVEFADEFGVNVLLDGDTDAWLFGPRAVKRVEDA